MTKPNLHPVVYLPVSTDTMPPMDSENIFIRKNGTATKDYVRKEIDPSCYLKAYSHWLKPIHNVHVLSEKELEEVLTQKDLIIKGIEEGSEKWKAKYENLKIAFDRLLLSKSKKSIGNPYQ